MNRKVLFRKINELCLVLDSKYNVNNGGCCYLAACISEQLELYNIPFKVIHYDLCGCHYAIKVSDRYLNRCDYRKKEITEILSYTSKDLFELYLSRNWNEMYKTKYNSTIKNLIQKLFDENSRT